MAEGRRSSRGREETWPPAATAAPDTATAMAMPMAAAAEEEEGVAELMVVVAAVVLAARSVLRMARQTAGSYGGRFKQVPRRFREGERGCPAGP